LTDLTGPLATLTAAQRPRLDTYLANTQTHATRSGPANVVEMEFQRVGCWCGSPRAHCHRGRSRYSRDPVGAGSCLDNFHCWLGWAIRKRAY